MNNFDYEKMVADQIKNGAMKRVLLNIDYCTFLNSLYGCSDSFKKNLLDILPEYDADNLLNNFERAMNTISEKDALKAKTKILSLMRRMNASTKMILDEKNGNILQKNYYCFGNKSNIIYTPQEIIPRYYSVDYNGFINIYYNLLWFLHRCTLLAKSSGLLELCSGILEPLDESDFVNIGINLILDVTDHTIIDQILSNYIESEKDLYKRRLKQIALKGILLIDEVESPEELIIILGDFSGIQDGCIDKACECYKKGDTKIFKNLFKKDSDLFIKMNEIVEREEITLIQKALEVLTIIQREGFSVLKEHKFETINNEIFEYGLYLLVNNYDKKTFIKRELDKMILDKASIKPYRLRFYQAQQAAILSIVNCDTTPILLEILLSYFGDDIAIIARKQFKDKL
jgi:flagellar motor component MotA